MAAVELKTNEHASFYALHQLKIFIVRVPLINTYARGDDEN